MQGAFAGWHWKVSACIGWTVLVFRFLFLLPVELVDSAEVAAL